MNPSCCTLRLYAIIAIVLLIATAPTNLTAQDHSAIRTSKLQADQVAPGFFKIGPVATNLWTFNALPVYDPQLKTGVLYITSFNSASLGQLIRLDYQHNRATSWTLPVGIGSWGIIQGQDGNIYLGSYNGGELLCFNPRTEKWLPLPQAPEAFRKKENIICSLAQAPNGDIYYGTYPGCHLVCYKPSTHEVTDLGQAADENYLRNVSVTPGGIVLCGVGPRKSRIVTYDPKTSRFGELEPPQYQNTSVSEAPLVSVHYVVQPSRDQVLVYDAKTLRFLRALPLPHASGFNLFDADHLLYQSSNGAIELLDLRSGGKKVYCAVPGAATDGRWYLSREGNLLSLHVQSYAYVDVKNHQTIRHRIPVDGLGQNVRWLRSTPKGLIYGGPELGQTLFSYNPRTHELKSYDQVIEKSGEIYYGVPYQGKLYTISYVEATMAVFDAARAWNRGDDAKSNPRMILKIPDQQYRPLGGIHLGPAGKMYIGTQPDYGVIGGALSVFDPQTEKVEVYRNLIPNEEINGVAADNRYVYGGASIEGGLGSKTVATHGHFFAWDPASRKIVFDQVLPTGNGPDAIATVNGHAYFVEGKQLMDYDSAAHALTSIYTFDQSRHVPDESLEAARDGTLWGIIGGELAHIDPARRNVQFFPKTAGKATIGITIGPDGTIYFDVGIDVWIYRPKSPSPPASFSE